MGGPRGPWRGGIGRPADDVLGRARHAGPQRDGIGLSGGDVIEARRERPGSGGPLTPVGCE